MTTLDKVKKTIETINPIAGRRRFRMRKQLINKDISFFTPNCIGGLLFHDLGLQFLSPTVNLMLTQTDFAKFILNLDEYLEKEFEFFCVPDLSCPCAHLGDVVIHFTHYQTAEEAEHKWKSRVKRIQRDNMFVFVEERDGLTEETIRELGKLPVKGLVVFTAHEYSDIPYALYLPQYHANGEVGNILKRSYLDDSREYESCFDFVKWFNEAEGYPFDIRPFRKI